MLTHYASSRNKPYPNDWWPAGNPVLSASRYGGGTPWPSSRCMRQHGHGRVPRELGLANASFYALLGSAEITQIPLADGAPPVVAMWRPPQQPDLSFAARNPEF